MSKIKSSRNAEKPEIADLLSRVEAIAPSRDRSTAQLPWLFWFSPLAALLSLGSMSKCKSAPTENPATYG